MSLQGRCWLRCTWQIGLKCRERTQYWMLCWTGWKPKRRLSSWESMFLVWMANWYWRNCHNFVIHQKVFYLCMAPKGKSEDLMLFVVPKVHWVTTLNGCHWDAGHQDHDHILSLLQECFWWPGMASQVQQAIRNCTSCLQNEGSLPKASLHPIVAAAPLDLLHVDFTSIETILGAKPVT